LLNTICKPGAAVQSPKNEANENDADAALEVPALESASRISLHSKRSTWAQKFIQISATNLPARPRFLQNVYYEYVTSHHLLLQPAAAAPLSPLTSTTQLRL
jgi:hypothetical protein